MKSEYYLLKISYPELNDLITEKEEKTFVIMTEDQYKEILHTAIKNTVHRTLVEIGLKTSSLQSGKIYRHEMVKVIGRWAFDQAIANDHLRVYKNDPTKRNSRVYAKRSDWERFLAWNVNRKI